MLFKKIACWFSLSSVFLFNELKISQNFVGISEILERRLKDIKLPKIFLE